MLQLKCRRKLSWWRSETDDRNAHTLCACVPTIWTTWFFFAFDPYYYDNGEIVLSDIQSSDLYNLEKNVLKFQNKQHFSMDSFMVGRRCIFEPFSFFPLLFYNKIVLAPTTINDKKKKKLSRCDLLLHPYEKYAITMYESEDLDQIKIMYKYDKKILYLCVD